MMMTQCSGLGGGPGFGSTRGARGVATVEGQGYRRPATHFWRLLHHVIALRSKTRFPTWRVATTCLFIHPSTPPHAITTSTHQRNCRHHFRVLLGISSTSAYITRLLCCVQPEVKIPHRTPAVTPSKGHRHLAPFARRQAAAHHRESESGCKPSLSPWWQCLGSGTTSSLPGEVSAGLRSPCLLGCPSGQGGVDDSLDAFIHISLRRREPSRTTALLLVRVKAAHPTSRKAWAGGILCRVHRSLPTQGFNFRHLLLN